MDGVKKVAVDAIRAAGRVFEVAGRGLESNTFVEKIQPSLRSVSLQGSTPSIGEFVAPTASVIGKVKIGKSSSVWYGAVVRGDVNSITIGNGVSIGDQAMVHCSGVNGDYPCVIGDNVVVGAGAIVHGCTVESGSMIGEGAQVLDGANIKKNAIVAPGALVPSGKTVGSGQLWAGVPAKMVRDLTPAEIASIDKTVKENIDLSVLHAEEASKSWQEIAEEAYITEQEVNRNEYYFKRLTKDQMQFKEGELENHTIPGRVLDTEVSARQDLPSAARV